MIKIYISLVFGLLFMFCFPVIGHAECDHNFYDTDKYEKIDGTWHAPIVKCSYCGIEKKDTDRKEKHLDYGYYDETYKKNDINAHIHSFKCVCGEWVDIKEEHQYSPMNKFRKCDDKYHYSNEECYACGQIREVKEKHDIGYDSDTPRKKIDNVYHGIFNRCTYCNAEILGSKEKHYFFNSECIQKATMSVNGIIRYKCYYCDAYYDKAVPWGSMTDDDRVTYNFNRSTVYRYSKSVSVKLDNPLKGAVIKIRIGKKTYIKTIKNNATKFKIKIKKHAYNKKISAGLYFKGKLVGQPINPYVDKVYYAKKIKKGMTKKQCKAVPGWEYPAERTVKTRTEIWWYDDNEDGYAIDSYLIFYKGKLKGWHE